MSNKKQDLYNKKELTYQIRYIKFIKNKITQTKIQKKMKEKITAKKWITCFCEDIKKPSTKKGKLYLAELRTMLAMFPIVNLPSNELVSICYMLINSCFSYVAEQELEKAKEDKMLAILLSNEMINKAVGLGNVSEEEFKNIEEFLLQEIKTEQKNMGKTLEQTLREETQEQMNFIWYHPFHSDISIQKIKLDILKSNVDENLQIYHRNIQKQRVENIIIQHYKKNGYTIENRESLLDTTTYFVNKDDINKVITYTSTAENILLITVKDI